MNNLGLKRANASVNTIFPLLNSQSVEIGRPRGWGGSKDLGELQIGEIEGVKNPPNFADVFNDWPQSLARMRNTCLRDDTLPNVKLRKSEKLR